MKPGYKQTEAGVIPEDWEVKQIGDFKPFVTSGSRGWAEYYSENGSLFIRITNLIRSSIYLDLDDLRFVNVPEINSEAARTSLQNDDVLVSITADIGIIGYISEKVPKPSYINQHIALIRFDSSSICPKFVSYHLASERPQKLFRALTDSGAKAGMNLSTVQKLLLTLPVTETEQRAIAEALSDADVLIESLEQLLAKKRNLKQGAMQELLTGKKRLPGFKGAWHERLLGEVASLYQPITISANQFTSFGYPVYGANGVVGFFNEYNHKDWQVTVTCRGSTCGTVNRTVDKCWITGNAMVIGCEGSKEINKSFLYYLLSSIDLSVCITGTGQPQIVRTPLANVFLRLPSIIEEQEAIATVLSDMDTEIATLETKLTKARQLKTGMMQELLTGRIRLV